MHHSIQSQRLVLTTLGAPILQAILAGNHSFAAALLGCRIDDATTLHELPADVRLQQLRDNPLLEPWLLRAVIDRESNVMLGHIGFHTAPCAEYLAASAADGVELGYTIAAPHRRQGFATEAAIALMSWAYAQHGQRCFVLSIATDNAASMAMATKLGFTPCGSHFDEVDGLEIELVRRFETWPNEWPRSNVAR